MNMNQILINIRYFLIIILIEIILVGLLNV